MDPIIDKDVLPIRKYIASRSKIKKPGTKKPSSVIELWMRTRTCYYGYAYVCTSFVIPTKIQLT